MKLSSPAHQALLSWFRRSARDLPWRRARTPYRVWISEIMLQQTQAGTVLPYFERFVSAYPGARELAAAPEDTVMALWAGLGYYSRARNLISCAREVATTYGGEFPPDANLLCRLPGFGPYTTAAVGSLAFGLPLAVLDGNVIRVLCRLFAVEEDSRRPKVRSALQGMADDLLDHDCPGEWNEAMMELGAIVCRPRNPCCAECPLAEACLARQAGRQEDLPLRASRPPRPVRPTLVLLVMDEAGRILARRRGDKGMLRGLWELPSCEERSVATDRGGLEQAWERLAATLAYELAKVVGELAMTGVELRFRHEYSHFHAQVLARRMRTEAVCPLGSAPGVHWLEPGGLQDRGFSARDRHIIKALLA